MPMDDLPAPPPLLDAPPVQINEPPPMPKAAPLLDSKAPVDIMRRYPYQRFITERQRLVDLLNSDSELNIRINRAATDRQDSLPQLRLMWEAFAKQNAKTAGVAPSDVDAFARSFADEKIGLDGLEDLIRDDSIDNIMILWTQGSAPVVRVSYLGGGGANLEMQISKNWETYRDTVVSRAIKLSHKQANLSTMTPYVDAVLSSYNVRMATSLTANGLTIVSSFRMNRVGDPDLADLLDIGLIRDPWLKDFLDVIVEAKCNVVFAGAQKSGKTTMLRGFINRVNRTEEIMIVEDISELDISFNRHDFVVSFEKSEYASMRSLISQAMRYVVQRIFVGEALDAAILSWFFAAVRARGSACTLHAESIDKVFDAIVGLSATNVDSSVAMSREVVLSTIANSVDFIVFMAPKESPIDHSRMMPTVAGILAIDNQVATDGTPKHELLCRWNDDSNSLEWLGKGVPDHISQRFANVGVALRPNTSSPEWSIKDQDLFSKHPDIQHVVDPRFYAKRSLARDPASAYTQR